MNWETKVINKKRARFLFVLGFEKCGTTALTQHLVRSGYGKYLVSQVEKESRIMLRAPILAGNLLRTHAAEDFEEIWIDGTVENIKHPSCMMTIAENAGDYRVIVCVRNQLNRLVSAFQFYKFINSYKMNHPDPNLRNALAELRVFADDAQMLANGQPVPRALLMPFPKNHYFHSCILSQDRYEKLRLSRLDFFDEEIEKFKKRSLMEQLLKEIRWQSENGNWEPFSLLANSTYNISVRRMLKILDPKKTMVISTPYLNSPNLNLHLADFLGVEPEHNYALEPANVTGHTMVSQEEIDQVETILSSLFARDTQSLVQTFEEFPGVNLSLFDVSHLYH